MTAVQLSLPGIVAQRWLEGEEHLAADDDPIDTWNYEIALIPDDNTARAFIERHHYSGTYVAARRRFGLWHRSGELRGVAVFSVPLSLHSLDAFQLDDPGAGLELGRLVLLDGVKKMGESWFVAEAFRRLRREGFRAVVSFSDPVPRTTVDGRQVVPGHVGIVYQALSARWLGRSKADTLRLLPDGRAVHRRAMQKIRGEERGWEREVKRLQAYGAGPLDREPRAWVDYWLPRITRPLRHCGNHRYGWGLDKWARRALGPPNPGSYPSPAAGRVPPRWGRRTREARDCRSG